MRIDQCINHKRRCTRRKFKNFTFECLHSPSQQIFYPFGFKKDVLENNEELKRLAKLAQDAIKEKQGKDYKFNNISRERWLYSGLSLDWVAMNSKSKYNFCFEMREGKYGFLLPEESIDPAFQDVWIGIDQLISNMKD